MRKLENEKTVSLSEKLYEDVVSPFVNLAKAPRALWGVNLSYFFEGFVYFGILGYLTMYFTQYIALGDYWSSVMVSVLTWGITLSMFVLGGVSDKIGVRKAILAALILMLIGRIIMSIGPYLGLSGGLFSILHIIVMVGILFIVIGYGMYQPAAYSAIKQFTTPETSAMGYAMLYALMNLGGWLPSFFSPVRRAVGIKGVFWVYTAFTTITILIVFFILTKSVVKKATEEALAGNKKADGDPEEKQDSDSKKDPEESGVLAWFKNHPLADGKFAFFIFALIPVQTLFAYNWLVLPKYVERAYQGTWLGKNFEVATNFNPLLIFILVPIVTALTMRKKIYTMMIWGTLIMAAPTFLLALGANWMTLGGYLIIMTIGEAMWQPRFLQYAAEIAPPGKTGAYMGVAQFPWFLTKFITGLYAGWFLTKYCPAKGQLNTEYMWLIFGIIAMVSPVLLIVAKGWLGKDFKEKA